MIIQERRHVDALVAPKKEGEEVRLPQLVGFRSFEAPLLGLRPRLRRLALLGQALLLQHPAHRGVGSANAEEAPHHIANPAAPRLRLGLLRRNHRLAARIALRAALAVTHRARASVREGRPARALWITACSARRLLERRSPTRSIFLRPLNDGRVRDPELRTNPVRRQTLVHHRACRRHHHVTRPGAARLPLRYCVAPLRRVTCLAFHWSSPFRLPCQP
jgi:hypothetical protein